MLLALTTWMLIQRPKAFIPTEDQGYLIVAIQTPDGTGRGPTSRIAQQQCANRMYPIDGFNS